MEEHKSPESWAKEGTALARKVVCMDGDLLTPRGDRHGDMIQVPAEYAPAFGWVTRVQVSKAGKRLADELAWLLEN
jgi:hypothetical protein